VIALTVALLGPWLLGWTWMQAIYKALVLLVIACPCALVISTPVTIVSGLAAAARRGILIKGGIYLEEARKLKAIALDKTGTITEGKPRLVDWAVVDLETERRRPSTSPWCWPATPTTPGLARDCCRPEAQRRRGAGLQGAGRAWCAGRGRWRDLCARQPPPDRGTWTSARRRWSSG
jgi:magnesium-transporting ATPase (P-type)